MAKPVVVITQPVHPDTLDRLRPHYRVRPNETGATLPPAEVLDRARDAFGLMAFMTDGIDDVFLAACPRLRIVAGALKGADNIDLEACAARDVLVSVCPDLLSAPTAELAIALALGLLRNLAAGDAAARREDHDGWRPRLYGGTLTNARVGILGLGGVGRELARRLRGFTPEVRFFDPRAEEIPEAERHGAAPVDLTPLLETSSVLFLCAPLTPGTLHLVDAARIATMTAGSLLVNVGRGSVVDEAAVAAALETGQLAGYAADVFEFEDRSRADRPQGVHPALRRAVDRTLLAPHLGSAVGAVRREIELEAAQSLIDVVEGRTPRGAVGPGAITP
jgi:phosphonate dehydrogenase